MSAPAEPVPTLELPSQALMQWSQMALLLAAQLAQRREQMQRLAWSQAEHAARAHDLAELRDAVEPAVRAMTPAEIAHWPAGTDNAGPQERVSAEVAAVNDRWALRAAARHEDGTLVHAWVSCREEHLARDLAAELLRRGDPELVGRLGAHIQLADALATAHHTNPPAVDRDAMAASVRAAWSAEVAAAALGCPAWPTLAAKLDAAQRDGHDLARLLGGINTSGMVTARKPAALACWILDQATADGPPPRHHELLLWADALDPSSAVDRAGALGVFGYSGAIDNRLLARFPDLIDQAARLSGQATAAQSLAGDRERSAAAQAAILDDPTTPRREDLDGQALAERDRHEAAAALATAAEAHAAANAAAARANVTLTPAGPAPISHASAQISPPPHPHPTQSTRLRRSR